MSGPANHAPVLGAAVVLVNWNGRHLLDTSLASVFRQSPAPMQVIVVDNGSSDDSLAYLRKRWPQVVAIDSGANLGFAAGCNVGIRHAVAAGASTVLLLNTDAELLPGALAELSAGLAQEPTAWAAAPKILYRARSNVIWSAGGSFDWWRGLSLDRGTNEVDDGQYDSPALMDFGNACCLLARVPSLRELGPFDEGYFMYFEDSELAARALRRGARVAYRPAARVLHDVQGSSGGEGGMRPSSAALYYWTRNRIRFIHRNAPDAARRLLAHAYVVGSRVVRIVQAARRGRWGDVRLIVRALVDGYVVRVTGPSYPARAATAARSSPLPAERRTPR